MVEIARHQIGAAEQERAPASRVEDVEAAVLEEPAEDAAHADGLAEARHARTKRADAARDDVDLRALLSCAVQLLDELLVSQVVGKDVPVEPLVELVELRGQNPSVVVEPGQLPVEQTRVVRLESRSGASHGTSFLMRRSQWVTDL